MRWDAARSASRRPLPKPRKMHGPVGDEALNTQGAVCDAEATYLRHGARTCFPHDSRCEPMTCRDCGYHVCSCDRTIAIEALREHGVISHSTLPPEHQIMGDHIAKRRAEEFEAARFTWLRACIVCSVPHNGSGAACLTCVQRADAEAKPFRDAMHEKIKTLAKHAFTKKLELAESIAKLAPLPRDAVTKLLTTGDWRDERGRFPSQKVPTVLERIESKDLCRCNGWVGGHAPDCSVPFFHLEPSSIAHQITELHPEFASERDRGAQAREVVPALVPDDLTPADAGADAELELRQPPPKP